MIIFLARTYEIARPNIQDMSNGHTIVGDALYLTCRVSVSPDSLISMKWMLPNKQIIEVT